VPAADLARHLRRLGFAFIAGLVLQVRVDGRLVALPLAALVVAWALWKLQAIVASPESDRAWRGAFGSAVAAVVVGIAGLVPAVEPGLISVLAGVLLLGGTISHCSLMSLWAHRAGWPDAQHHYERARLWCTANLALSAVGTAALLVLGSRPTSDGDVGTVPPGVVLGRLFEGATVIVVLVAVTVLWVASMVALQMANRRVRTGLGVQPEAVVPLA
jgi:hypothetical protein